MSFLLRFVEFAVAPISFSAHFPAHISYPLSGILCVAAAPRSYENEFVSSVLKPSCFEGTIKVCVLFEIRHRLHCVQVVFRVLNT